jgi:hypothetical protein
VTLGVPIAWWLSRGFAALLVQVTPADVSVYVGERFAARWPACRQVGYISEGREEVAAHDGSA